MVQENRTPLSEKGKTVFQNNCGMCHKLDKPFIGPALSCITNSKGETDFKAIIGGENGHPMSKLSEQEIKALIEFIQKNCP